MWKDGILGWVWLWLGVVVVRLRYVANLKFEGNQIRSKSCVVVVLGRSDRYREIVIDVRCCLVKKISPSGVPVLYTSNPPSKARRNTHRGEKPLENSVRHTCPSQSFPRHQTKSKTHAPQHSKTHFAVNGSRFPVNGNVQIMRPRRLQTKAVGAALARDSIA
jgi:hypothetical protein